MIKDAFRFAFIVGTTWIVYYFLLNGYEAIHYGVASSLADGAMRGPLGFIWQTFVWMVYIVLVIGVLIAAYLALGFFGLGVWIIEKIGGLLAKVKSAWFGASDVTDPKKLPTAIKQVLSEFQRRIKELEAKTAGLKPPAPPKSADELLRERDKQLAELTEQLAKLQAKGAASE